MRGILSEVGLSVLLGGVAFGALVCASAQQPASRRGVLIQVSEPKRDPIGTNLSQLTSAKTPLNNLEDDLKKPFEAFGAGDSFSSMPIPLVRPAVPRLPSPRARELLEKQKFWYLLTPEETFGVPSTEGVLNVPEMGPDGNKKDKLSPLERFYQRLDAMKSGETNQPGGDSLRGLMSALDSLNDRPDSDAFDVVSNRISNTTRAFERPFDSAPDRPPIADPIASASFGSLFGTKELQPDDWSRGHAQRMKEFDQIIGPGPVSTPAAGTLGAWPGTANSAGTPGYGSLGNYSGSGHQDSLSPLPSTTGVPLPLPSMPEVATAPAYPSLTPALPPPAQSQRPLMAPPTFEIPKRKF